MKQLSRYILKQLIISMVLITFVMSGIIWLFVAVRVVESIVNRGMSIELFFILTALQLPNFLSQILPISIFISTLYVYSRLSAERELTILKSAGLGSFALSKPAIYLSLVVTTMVYSLTLYATPLTYKVFRDLQWDLRYSLAGVVLREGFFNTFAKDITVYVRERKGEDELSGIMVHDSRDKARPITYHAETGKLTKSENSAKVVLLNGSSVIIEKDKPEINRVIFFDRHVMDLSNVIQKPMDRYREPRERGIRELIKLTKNDIGNPNDFGKFKVEAHQRIAFPISSIGFALIALSAILLGDFSRRGSLKRVIAAVTIFVAMTALNLTLVSICAKQLALIPALYVANLLPIVLAALILFSPTPLTIWYNKKYSQFKAMALK